MVVRTTSQREPPHAGGLAALHQAAARLDREGFWWGPTRQALRAGARPQENVVGEPGGWQHGRQYWAFSVSDTFFRETTMLSVPPAAGLAHLSSQSGPNAPAASAQAPTAFEHAISLLFWVIVLETLQLQLSIAEATCSGCQAPLDPRGRHCASRNEQALWNG